MLTFNSTHRKRWLLVVSAAGVIFASAAKSAVTLDNTLGPAVGALAGPDYVIPESFGQTRGTNLFHSFGQFSLTSAESATFTGAAGIQNIIGRVTGGEVSNIDGLVRSSISGANLYLINPSGIMFGPNARLDVSGSFYASSADYLGLADGGRFDARTPANDVLTTASPAAFGFLDVAIAPIVVAGSQLAVPTGMTLGLVGGDLTVAGSNTEPDISDGPWTLAAVGGRVELVALASAGEAELTGSGTDTSGFATLGDITIHQGASVSTRGDVGGTIYIRGGRLVLESSVLNASILGAIPHPGRAIDIDVRNDIELRIASSGYRGHAEIAASSYGAGNAGNMEIRAGQLLLRGDPGATDGGATGAFALIGSRAFGTGESGDVVISAGTVDLGRSATITTESYSAGGAGSISVAAQDLRITGTEGHGSFISSTAYASGNAGNLAIDATDITLQGGVNAFVGFANQAADTSGSSNANSGSITVDATRLTLLDGAQINAGVYGGAGNAGNISVDARDIHIAGINAGGYAAGIISETAGWYTSGNGGNISVQADNLVLMAGGRINTSALSFGGAGDIAIQSQNVRIEGAGILDASTGLFAVSGWLATHGGNIRVAADNLELVNGGIINSQTVGGGPSGDVTLDVGRLLVTGVDTVNDLSSQVLASTAVYYYPQYATGNGGNIRINAREVEVANDGRITAESKSQGDGGGVTIDAVTIAVNNGGSINANSTQTGRAGNLIITAAEALIMNRGEIATSAAQSDGGDIVLNVGHKLYLNNSTITTAVQGGSGNGGNIFIDPDFVILNHSRIAADALGGNGGNVTIIADNFLASTDSSVTASSTLGLPGSVVIRAPTDDLSGDIENLPETALDAASLFKNNCVAVGSRFSSFIIRRPAASTGHGLMLSSYSGINIEGGPAARSEEVTGTDTGASQPLLSLANTGGCRL